MPIPFLPNELVDEILRYDCLSGADLCRTALVSTRWLEPSRTSLYYDVSIVLRESPSFYEDPDRTGAAPKNRYTAPTWKLLATLTDNRRSLAMRVKCVSFRYDNYEEEAMSPVITLPSEAVSTAFALASAATTLQFDSHYWLDNQTRDRLYLVRERVEHLHIGVSADKCWSDIAVHFPNLRSLVFACVADPVKRLHLPHGSKELVAWCLRDCASSIRHLNISLEAALSPTFDLSTFTNLSSLGITTASSDTVRNLSFRDAYKFILSWVKLKYLVTIDLKVSVAEHLGRYLPPSCVRVNLVGKLELEPVLQVLQGRGEIEEGLTSHIRQIGLQKNSGARLVTAGIKAMAHEAGVEIIWMTGNAD